MCMAGRCEYAGGYSFTTLLCEQRRYLPWLTERALRAGVTLAHRTITSLRVRHARAPAASQCSLLRGRVTLQ